MCEHLFIIPELCFKAIQDSALAEMPYMFTQDPKTEEISSPIVNYLFIPLNLKLTVETNCVPDSRSSGNKS